jgi:hypothetical protein
VCGPIKQLQKFLAPFCGQQKVALIGKVIPCLLAGDLSIGRCINHLRIDSPNRFVPVDTLGI